MKDSYTLLYRIVKDSNGHSSRMAIYYLYFLVVSPKDCTFALNN